jgi:hypothetical protein
MQNQNRRAVAGSNTRSRNSAKACRTCDESWIGTAVVLALADSAKQSFNALLRSTGAGQSPLAAALAQLRTDSWILQDDSGNFRLSTRGLNLVDEGRRRGGRRQRAA